MAEQSTNSTPATDENSRVRSDRSHREHPPKSSNEDDFSDRYTVVFSLGWVVRGAETGQDVINIAVSEVGKRVASTGEQTRKVDISVQRIGCNRCGTGSDALLLVSETALVGLFLEVEVDAKDSEIAEKIARREVGPNLHNTPLTSVDIEPVD
jgi:uncharacterized protein (UPF0212 family)